MPTFAVTYTYTDDAAGRDELRPAHREYLTSLPALKVASAYADQPAGALLVFAADDAAGVRAIVEADPFVTAGLVASYDVREWNPVLGPVAAAFS